MYTREEYLQHKQTLVGQLARERFGEARACLRLLLAQAPAYVQDDLDVAWMRIVLATKDFSRKMSLAKARRIMQQVEGKRPVGDGEFAKRCDTRATEFLTKCDEYDKRAKRRAVVWSATTVLLVAAVVLGVVFVDRSGVLYGAADLIFRAADGSTVTARDAVRYNEHVRLALPLKEGYTATGVYDAATGRQLFDADGVSLSAVQSRSLDDYADCELVVQYQPTVYAACISNTSGLALSSFEYTVETVPADVLDDPQELPGYVFDDWYTDSKFKNRFSGDFADYIDLDKPLVLYAHYVLDGWTITWDLGGGTLVGDRIDDYTILSDVSLPDETLVVREGYRLDGWQVAGKRIEHFSSSWMKDVTITAHWTPVRYAVNYVCYGGVPEEAVESYTVEDEVVFCEPTRAGYLFDGWYTSRAFATRVYGIDCGSMGDVTVYAHWTPVTYAVNYRLNGGAFDTGAPTAYTVEDAVTLVEPRRTGYDFCGWSLDGAHVDAFDVNWRSDVTLIAHWTPVRYTVTYVLSGGELDNPVDSYTVEEAVVFGIPHRLGYDFDGWYASRAFRTVVEEIERGTIGNLTLYAKWTPKTYTLTYVLDGGDFNATAPTDYTVEDEVILPVPQRAGYAFAGWYLMPSNEIEIVSIAMGTAVSTTVLARWTLIDYRLTYVTAGGTFDADVPTVYTVEDEVVLPVPTRVGYRFKGWYTSPTYLTPLVLIARGTASSVTVYALWEAVSYTLTVVTNGGELAQSLPTVLTIEDMLVLPVPTKRGYTFLHWVTPAGEVVRELSAVDANRVITATWAVNRYTIGYVAAGGTVDDNAVTSYTVEDEVCLPAACREGYRFDGWYTSRLYTERASDIAAGSVGNVNVYAKWTPEVYRIDYVLNGGENSAYNALTFTVEAPVTLDAPSREGYRFDGWYEDALFAEPISVVENVARNVTVYAKWTPNLYTVSVVPTVGAPYQVALDYDAYYKLAAPEVEGYTFEAFEYAEESVPFAAQGLMRDARDLVVTARYTANLYHIDYYDGATLIARQAVRYAEPFAYVTPDAQPNREFVAWYRDRNLTVPAVDITYLATADSVVYAQFLTTATIELASDMRCEIGPQVDKAYLVGAYREGGPVLENVQVVVLRRHAALTIYLDNVGFAANDYETAIQFDNSSYALTFVVLGNSYIRGGHGPDGTASSLDGKYGNPVFVFDGNVSIEAIRPSCTLTLVGGDGGNGHRGANGADGYAGSVGWDDYGWDGGNGDNGGNGGRGGNGGAALSCNKLYVNSKLTLDLRGGNAGAGGDGGNGGRGGDGGYVDWQTWYDNVIVDEGRIHGVSGGNGGNGGNGGAPGKPGEAVCGSVVCANVGATVNKTKGCVASGGAAGTAGRGGNAGSCKYVKCIIIALYKKTKYGSAGINGINGNNG